MSIKHHPDDSTLIAYASGTLDEAFAIVISCHIETCTSCRSSLKSLEMIGGATLENTDTVDVDNGAFDRILEEINTSKPINQSRVNTVKSTLPWNEMPRALQGYLPSNISDVEWKGMGLGVWQNKIPISKSAKSTLRLLRISPGIDIPEHGHNGQELTLIIRGAYQDEIGYFGPGDVADLDLDTEHQPHVVSDQDCICLVATEAPTRFKGLANRLLQPFFGI